jgi:hypothetical protein
MHCLARAGQAHSRHTHACLAVLSDPHLSSAEAHERQMHMLTWLVLGTRMQGLDRCVTQWRYTNACTASGTF